MQIENPSQHKSRVEYTCCVCTCGSMLTYHKDVSRPNVVPSKHRICRQKTQVNIRAEYDINDAMWLQADIVTVCCYQSHDTRYSMWFYIDIA